MKRLVADCETDGLLDKLTKLHCLAFLDLDTEEVHSFADQPGHRPIEEGLRILAEADLTIWHNGISFDVPAIRKVYSWWKPKGVVRDTMLIATLVFPKNPVLFEMDRKSKTFPKNLMGRHSLEAFGHRLGNYKGDYKGGWAAWSPEMHSYMEQDCRVTADVWRWEQRELASWRGRGEQAIELEHEVAWIISRQERYGVGFDIEKAGILLGQLQAQYDTVYAELQNLFPPKTVRTPFIPKVNSKKFGYEKGVLTYKVKEVPFNPASRDHVAERLIEMGWKPTERTDNGKWKVDDDILNELPFPEAKKLAKLFEIAKRIGTLSTGKEALLKHYRPATRTLHHRCNSNGAVTGRGTHSNPNINLPKVKKDKSGILSGSAGGYGWEFRELFRPVKKHGVQVGVDADSLEARVEAGFTVPYDGGAYRETILNGRKEDGTDLHSRNRDALIPIFPMITRDTAKNTKYAWTYGAGDWKIAVTAGMMGTDARLKAAGAQARKKLLAASPGLKALVEAVETALTGKAAKGNVVGKPRGYLIGLDGRRLFIRSKRAAVNTLFQSAGALIFKQAMVICHTELTGVRPSVIGAQGPEAATKLVPGKDFEQMLWVHDEVQFDARDDGIASVVGAAMVNAIKVAGEHFKCHCPMAGNADYGRNWAECH